MKKIFTLFMLLSLYACSAKQPDAPIALDYKVVEEYQQKVMTGDTVPAHKKKAYSDSVESPLNASDSRVKQDKRAIYSRPVLIMPSVGYHYSHYR
ncbi:putative lipoprotein [Pasteurella multocida]|nr:putative lipoprotein [Pasteurella multocida]